MKIADATGKTHIERIVKFLSSAPKDEVFTSRELTKLISAPSSSIGECIDRLEAASMSAKVSGRRYWGNATAIKELLRLRKETK
jgi:hypothetical protein